MSLLSENITESEIDELDFEYDEDESFPDIDEYESNLEEDYCLTNGEYPNKNADNHRNGGMRSLDAQSSLENEASAVIKDEKTESSKHSEFTFTPLTIEEYISGNFIFKLKRLEQLNLPHCDSDDLLIMLHSESWQEEMVINAYYDNAPKLFENSGLPQLQKEHKNNKFSIEKNFLCPICCCDDDIQVETYSLTCGHQYCTDCYGRYISEAVHDGKLITCPECSLVVPHKDVQLFHNEREKLEVDQDTTTTDDIVYTSTVTTPVSIISKSRVFIFNPLQSDLLRYAAKVKIGLSSNRKNFKWCPAPDCRHLVEMEATGKGIASFDTNSTDILAVPIVRCPNSHEFCFQCQYENHLPCPCWIVQLWIKKCNDDSETANWLEANTHTCPQCDTLIEKNGGCNHMTCKKCAYDFCWICFQPWDIHGQQFYQCNKYDPDQLQKNKKLKKLKRLTLTRYLFFFKRFSIHETSMKGDLKTLNKVNNRMKKFMEEELNAKNRSGDSETILSWIDIQFLNDAIKQLTNGRKTLKWTYAFAFYLESSNFSEIFEQMQDYLNKTVEDLSHIFEEITSKKNENNSSKLILKHKQEIMNLSNLVSQRQEKLIECAYTGLNQGLLKLEQSVNELVERNDKVSKEKKR